MSDALGTCLGACLGTSTVTSYVESTTGVAEGGRTGLTALTSAILFILAIPLYPIFLAIPSVATAPALVFVGLLMIKNVTKMDFDSDIADTVGGFVAIIFMPFAYSIATGIMFGILTWVILKIVTGKIKRDSSDYVGCICFVCSKNCNTDLRCIVVTSYINSAGAFFAPAFCVFLQVK